MAERASSRLACLDGMARRLADATFHRHEARWLFSSACLRPFFYSLVIVVVMAAVAMAVAAAI